MGFLKQKNIHTCTANVINCVSQAWANNEGTGIMCVDFSKAFDSIKHTAIDECLKFFNFGTYMRGMVKTILNDRKARIFFNAVKNILLLINLAQHRTPPPPAWGRGSKHVKLLAFIISSTVHIAIVDSTVIALNVV
jgi:hypothetical protein